MPNTPHESVAERPGGASSASLAERTSGSIDRLGAWLSDLAQEDSEQEDGVLESIRQVLRAYDPTTTTPETRRSAGRVLGSLFQNISHALGLPSIDTPLPGLDEEDVPPPPQPPAPQEEETPTQPPAERATPPTPPAPRPTIDPPPPPPPPPPAPRPQPEVTAPPESTLALLPENVNLVGGEAIRFRFNGADHTVQFSRNGVTLDGTAYGLTAVRALLGADVPINLIEVRRRGDTLLLKAGALGIEDQTDANESELRLTLSNLLTSGRHTQRTRSGRTVRIGSSR